MCVGDNIGRDAGGDSDIGGAGDDFAPFISIDLRATTASALSAIELAAGGADWPATHAAACAVAGLDGEVDIVREGGGFGAADLLAGVEKTGVMSKVLSDSTAAASSRGLAAP
jgi:hypothetical protein